jgi:DNA modification methylase
MKINHIYEGDCIEGLRLLPDESVDCCVTSPPYFNLRDYGQAGQIGLEETPERYLAKMVEVFGEVRRVLKSTGTLWLNLGDSYSTHSAGKVPEPMKASTLNRGLKNTPLEANRVASNVSNLIKKGGLPEKNLLGIPWRVAFALQSSGWILRQDIIWHKPNPMPESVTDRCTKSHEYIFLLSKSSKYYYDADAIKQSMAESSIERLSQNIELQLGSDRVPGKTNGRMKAVRANGIVRDRLLDYDSKEKLIRGQVKRGGYEKEKDLPLPEALANKRSVWTITTKPFSEAHFATFPEDLIVDMIKAGCPEDGIVLDPFMGAGTTALVASKLNRNFIGFELNPEYIKIAKNRLQNQLGMFNKCSTELPTVQVSDTTKAD